MLESPLLRKTIAAAIQDVIFDALKDRFGTVPRDMSKHLRKIIDEKKLRKLNLVAIKCPDLPAFREALLS